MSNRDLDAAWKYHDGTKHSYHSVRLSPHLLDWNNKPSLFKIYPTLEAIRLPKYFRPTGVAALSAVASPGVSAQAPVVPELEGLAQVLFFSAGVTKSKTYPGGGENFFRAAACTGALYEIEIYVVCQDLPELPAGVYHFGAAEFGLRQLRDGDFRMALADATANEPSVVHAPVTLVFTGTYWRNAWKYRSRTYRHFGWDNGTILANLLAMTAAVGLPAKVLAGFVDSSVNALLDLDPQKEVAFSLVSLGFVHDSPPPPEDRSYPLFLPVIPYSATEVDFPPMRLMHQSSSLESPEEVAAWRADEPSSAAPAIAGCGDGAKSVQLSASIDDVIRRRGSTRQFSRDPISFEQLNILLDSLDHGIPADFESGPEYLNHLYLIVNHVEGVDSGAYYYQRDQHKLELLKAGDFRPQAAYLGLEQELPGDAAVNFYFLADLKKVFDRYGNRGYRAVQLEAGILGGKLYLAAYAQKLGATGLTFYDDEVVRFFSPHAKDKSAIFLVATGKSQRQTLNVIP